MISPVFVLGAPRSGTTLLASLLRESRFGEPVETHFITKYHKKLASYGDLNDKSNCIKLIADILGERPVKQWGLSVSPVDIYSRLDMINYKNIVNELCMERSSKNGYTSWGDKTPHYIMDLEIIYELFPESQYIYIVRDGRDVSLSLLDREWGPNNILTCAEYWKKCNEASKIYDKLQNSKQLYFLRYEDLLDNAEEIVPDIYRFLGEEYNESSMKKLTSSIRKGNYGKWKKKMSAGQVKLFERVAANTLQRFGYETSYEEADLNGLIRAGYKIHDSIIKAGFLFKINVVDGIKIRFFGKEPFAD
jgi:hypothetical protein